MLFESVCVIMRKFISKLKFLPMEGHNSHNNNKNINNFTAYLNIAPGSQTRLQVDLLSQFLDMRIDANGYVRDLVIYG